MKWPWDIIAWWELRRILYNVALLLAGCISIDVVQFVGERNVKPGVDVDAPIGLIFIALIYGFLANVCYTLGWISELLWRPGDDPANAVSRRRKVFWTGTFFSIGLTLLPAVIIPLLWLISGPQR